MPPLAWQHIVYTSFEASRWEAPYSVSRSCPDGSLYHELDLPIHLRDTFTSGLLIDIAFGKMGKFVVPKRKCERFCSCPYDTSRAAAEIFTPWRIVKLWIDSQRIFYGRTAALFKAVNHRMWNQKKPMSSAQTWEHDVPVSTLYSD